MAKFDRYGGPEAWDAYTDEIDRMEAAEKQDATCDGCDNCEKPNAENPSRLGWCKWDRSFTFLDDDAEDCGGFIPLVMVA